MLIFMSSWDFLGCSCLFSVTFLDLEFCKRGKAYISAPLVDKSVKGKQS